ncbi:MAG: hypothetical protein ACM3KI_11025 [Bacillota bacterium]
MKTTAQPKQNATWTETFKALSYIGALFAVFFLTFAGEDLINWIMKLIFKV